MVGASGSNQTANVTTGGLIFNAAANALSVTGNIISSGNVGMSAVPGTNTNAALPVLFQTSAGIIDGGSGLTYNPASDQLSVNGMTISSGTVSGAGSLATFTCANGAGQYDFRAANDSLRLIAGSSEAMRIISTGDVGIGTSSPGVKLVIKQASGDLQFAMQGAVKNWNFRNQADGTFGYYDDSLGYWRYYYDTSNNHIWFNGASVERMRLDSGGNVGIGTSSPNNIRLSVDSGSANFSTAFIKGAGAVPDNNDNAVLYVFNAGTSGTGLRVRTDQALTGSNFAHILVNNVSASINGLQVSQYGTGYIASFDKSGTVALRIDNSGNVGIGTSSPTQTLMLGSGYIQTGQGVGGAGGVRFPYSSDAAGRTWRARSDITGYGDFGLEQSTTQTGNTYATRLLITQAGVLQFNSGYGSAATAYGCRAWCQYDSTPTIIGSGNITSITVVGTGDVRLNFATALVDANFSAVATTNESGGQPKFCNSTQPSTATIRIVTFNANGSTGWFEYNSVAVFR
jgi:hypothetical protein